MLPDDLRQAAALAILAAEDNARAIPQLSKTHPDIDLDDAYDIQRRCGLLRAASGAKAMGYKVGLTSEAMRAPLRRGRTGVWRLDA